MIKLTKNVATYTNNCKAMSRWTRCKQTHTHTHKWLTAKSKHKRKAWQGWLTTQRCRSSVMLIRWAHREGAEKYYTGMKPEPDGELQTISSRLEAAANTWGNIVDNIGLNRLGPGAPKAFLNNSARRSR